ncbi:hypothetical protein CO179_01440 [candidate division WWE3 bacterium CG_4_9_14_3_um_filter_39_7]|uniref:Type 4a pilus biogenesis protein PilO n=2 Tax=Bacteria candidate phyla TaxID=1783234 RepID=A0A2M7X433_UNCKA|nr:MAG: hypothetical protein COU10_03720 [Candidatus Harrisonbacteria bacterium CG10_big_fil_rev_8_21_14_0_10_45_28]PJA40761.1 MAG: hypothetical protein CO179_01440 [candidate division WWE3 bacterium CG_4_9_14_3_um_filter_39_7]
MENFKRRLIISVSLLVGALLIFIILIILVNSDLNKSAENISAIKNQVVARNQAIEVIAGSASIMDEVRYDTKVLEKILPNKDELINLPTQLEALAASLHLEFAFRFGAEKSGDTGQSTIDFVMTLAGQYENIRLFLSDLEIHRYIISLGSMDLQHGQTGGYSLSTAGTIFIAKSNN